VCSDVVRRWAERGPIDETGGEMGPENNERGRHDVIVVGMVNPVMETADLKHLGLRDR
jgi:hypothetical protein